MRMGCLTNWCIWWLQMIASDIYTSVTLRTARYLPVNWASSSSRNTMPARPHVTGNSAPCGPPVLYAFFLSGLDSVFVQARLMFPVFCSVAMTTKRRRVVPSCFLECIMHLSFSMTKSDTIVVQAYMLCLASLTSIHTEAESMQ